MVRGSSERNGEIEPVKRRQQPIEQSAIFDRELAGQPIVSRVVEVEFRLHRGEVGRPCAEGMKRAAKLVALRPVLGIVNHNEFAARKRQRVVQRLRLGARRDIRHHDDFDIAGKAECPRRLDGAWVRRFEDELDIELSRWPVDAGQRFDEARQHVRLAVERHEDRVDGKLVVLHARSGASLVQRRRAQKYQGSDETKGDQGKE